MREGGVVTSDHTAKIYNVYLITVVVVDADVSHQLTLLWKWVCDRCLQINLTWYDIILLYLFICIGLPLHCCGDDGKELLFFCSAHVSVFFTVLYSAWWAENEDSTSSNRVKQISVFDHRSPVDKIEKHTLNNEPLITCFLSAGFDQQKLLLLTFNLERSSHICVCCDWLGIASTNQAHHHTDTIALQIAINLNEWNS